MTLMSTNPFTAQEIGLLTAAVYEMKQRYPDDPDWLRLLKRLVELRGE